VSAEILESPESSDFLAAPLFSGQEKARGFLQLWRPNAPKTLYYSQLTLMILTCRGLKP